MTIQHWRRTTSLENESHAEEGGHRRLAGLACSVALPIYLDATQVGMPPRGVGHPSRNTPARLLCYGDAARKKGLRRAAARKAKAMIAGGTPPVKKMKRLTRRILLSLP